MGHQQVLCNLQSDRQAEPNGLKYVTGVLAAVDLDDHVIAVLEGDRIASLEHLMLNRPPLYSVMVRA